MFTDVVKLAEKLVSLQQQKLKIEVEIQDTIKQLTGMHPTTPVPVSRRTRRKLNGWAKKRYAKATKKVWAEKTPEQRRLWIENIKAGIRKRVEARKSQNPRPGV